MSGDPDDDLTEAEAELVDEAVRVGFEAGRKFEREAITAQMREASAERVAPGLLALRTAAGVEYRIALSEPAPERVEYANGRPVETSR